MPISGVGVKPDGTLTWIDANGNEVNPDGTPIPGAAPVQPLQPAANTAPQGGIPTPFGTVGAGPPPPPPAAPPAKQDTSARNDQIKQLIKDHGPQIGASSPVTTNVKIPANHMIDDGHGGQKTDPDAGSTVPQDTGYDQYNFQDGTSIELSPDGLARNYKPASAAATNANNPAPVTANTTDPKIVMRDPKTGAITTVDNPNYKQPAPTSVTANTTDPNIVTRDANGNITTQPNPNYKKPAPTTVATNTTDPSIVTRDADGNITTQPNPNYQPPAAAPIATNTTDPTIVLRDPKTGAISTQPNPNYQPAAAAPIAANTTDPTIVLRDPKTGAISTQANPNYQKPSPNVVGTPGTGDQFILTRDPTTGAVSQQLNPNYVPPKPTQITPSTTAPYITTQDAKGNMTSVPNPSYVPTDPGRMTQQLQQQIDAQAQTLHQQVTQGSLTPDQAASQFNQFWQENVEPVKGDITAAQAKAQAALAYQQSQTGYENALAANIPATLAQNASDAAQRNFTSMMPYLVNSSAGTTPGITTNSKGFPQINIGQVMANATYSLPNLQDIGRQGAAAALAHISPTAQNILAQGPGQPAQPPVPGLDINSMLNQSAYGFGAPPAGAAGGPPASGAPPAPPAPPQAPYTPNVANGPIPYSNASAPAGPNPGMPAPPVPPTPPAPPPGIDWNALLQRQQQDAMAQQVQSQIPWGTYQPAMS